MYIYNSSACSYIQYHPTWVRFLARVPLLFKAQPRIYTDSSHGVLYLFPVQFQVSEGPKRDSSINTYGSAGVHLSRPHSPAHHRTPKSWGCIALCSDTGNSLTGKRRELKQTRKGLMKSNIHSIITTSNAYLERMYVNSAQNIWWQIGNNAILEPADPNQSSLSSNLSNGITTNWWSKSIQKYRKQPKHTHILITKSIRLKFVIQVKVNHELLLNDLKWFVITNSKALWWIGKPRRFEKEDPESNNYYFYNFLALESLACSLRLNVCIIKWRLYLFHGLLLKNKLDNICESTM